MKIVSYFLWIEIILYLMKMTDVWWVIVIGISWCYSLVKAYGGEANLTFHANHVLILGHDFGAIAVMGTLGATFEA